MNHNPLSSILAAPESPVETPTGLAWEPIEAQIGKLPDDYKSFIEVFGSGTIDNFLWILNPFSKNKHANLMEKIPIILEAERTLKHDWPDLHPYKLFPEPGGLLPFGGTDNGDVLFWERVGNPGKWSVVVNGARDQDFEKFDLTMNEFLSKVLNRSIRCSIFPDDFPTERPAFTSMRI